MLHCNIFHPSVDIMRYSMKYRAILVFLTVYTPGHKKVPEDFSVRDKLQFPFFHSSTVTALRSILQNAKDASSTRLCFN